MIMKGVAMIAWALLIFTFVSIFMFTTVFVYRYRITLEINYEYNYNSVQLALMALLSSTHEQKQVSESLSEHISLNKPMDISIIEDKLDKLIESRCYNLTAGDIVVEGTNTDCNKKYASIAKIPLPYSPENKTEDVILVVG
jgi:hypothetical protein